MNDEYMPEERDIITEVPPTPEKSPFWGGWATFGFGLVIFFITLIAQVLAGFVAVFVYMAVTGDPGAWEIENALELYGGIVSSVSVIGNAIVGTGLIFIIIKVRRGLSFSEYLGFRRISPLMVLGLLVLFALYFGFMFVITMFVGEQVDDSSYTFLYNTDIWPVLVVFAFCIVAPFYEEIWIRGFLFEGLARSRIGGAGAIILTSLFWSVQHFQYSWLQIGMIFVLGLVLGLVRLKTKSLWAPIILHVINNSIAMIELFLT